MRSRRGCGGFARGSLDPKSARGGRSATSTVLFVAHDKRAPRVRLRTRQLDTLASCRIAVVVDSWYVCHLSPCNIPSAEFCQE